MQQHTQNQSRRKMNRKAIISFMFSFLSKGWKFIIGASIAAVFVSALSLANVFLAQQFNSLIHQQIDARARNEVISNATINFYGGILIAIYCLTFIINYGLSLTISYVIESMGKRLTDFLYAKILRTQVVYYDRMKTGEFLSRVNNDIDAAIAQLPQTLSQIFATILIVISMLIAMLIISPLLTVFVGLILPISFLGAIFIVKKSQKYYRVRQATLGELNAFAEEAISGQHEVNLFNQRTKFLEKFNKLNANYSKNQYKVDFWFSFIFPWNRFVGQLMLIMINVIGLSFAYNNIATYGIYDYMLFPLNANQPLNQISYYGSYIVIINTFLLMLRNFQEPLYQVINTMNVMQSFFSSSERLKELSDATEEFLDSENLNVKLITDKLTKKTIQPLPAFLNQKNLNIYQKYVSEKRLPYLKPAYYHYLPTVHLHTNIEVKNLSFAYEPNKWVLKNINFTVKQGQTVAIVGPTGSGKSTFINLLTKFYDISKGDILFDGVSIKKITKPSMRSNVSIVLQDNVIFSDTIFNNIKYGHMNATEQEVIQAAKMAKAHNFIMQLENGYDTVLKNNGENLSHGQKQLIGIARAILSPSELLILDEATSSVDTSTEVEIQAAMLNLVKNKTTFLIAHRLSTIRNADLIIVLKFGEIIEQGTHEQLLTLKNGLYAQMYHSQTNFE